MQLKIYKTNWKKVRLGDVATEYSKRIDNPSKSKFERFVGSSNIGQWDFRIQSWESTDSVTSSMKLFEPNDYLLVRRSLYASDFRERAPRATFGGVCSGDILTIKENPEMLADGFLIGILNSPSLWKYVVANASGSITRRIKWKDLANYEFLLPPKDQQAQLAELLWAMDEVIERELDALEKLDLTYTALIEKTLINKDASKLFFSDLLKVVRGVGYEPDQLLDNYDDKTYIILRSNNISNSVINYLDVKFLSAESVKKEQKLIEGDFAICMSNGSKELVGKAAEYIDYGKNVSIGSFCACLRPFSKENKILVKHLLNSESYRYAIKSILTGSAINNLKPSDIEGVFFRVDINQIKKGLLNKLEFMYENKSALGTNILNSKSLQKSLINQIF